MEFVNIRSFNNYIDAHIAMGRLQEEDINGWLKDENTVTIDPILTHAIGGIKLMIPLVQAERAIGILRALENEHKSHLPCPECGSLNYEQVTSPRKISNWAGAIIGLLLTDYAISGDKVNHCFDCKNEFPITLRTDE